jgi:hypothetical protein
MIGLESPVDMPEAVLTQATQWMASKLVFPVTTTGVTTLLAKSHDYQE